MGTSTVKIHFALHVSCCRWTQNSSPAGSGSHRCGPDAFVVETSMVRHVYVTRCHTFCYPGAFVNDITNSAIEFSQHNSSVSTIVVHTGTNDLKLQQSETLKQDFITLIHSIKQLKKQCIISGPLPSPWFGDIKFSRLQQLHIWLKRHCNSNNNPYVYNFKTFYNRHYLFKDDGLHPNHTGSNLFSMNIKLTLHSNKPFTD